MPSRSIRPHYPRDIAPGDRVMLFPGDPQDGHIVREVVKKPATYRPRGRLASPCKYRIVVEERPGYVAFSPNKCLGVVLHYCQHCGEYVVQRDGAWEADGLIGRENYESKAARLHCDKSEDGRHG